MNDIGSSSSNGSSGGQDSHGSSGDSKLCRDFIRNVCHRGKNCKFIHAENIKIRNEPIFCHDFQQNRCHRPTCKFIHCSREIEEHYKKTGELPESVYENHHGQGQNGHGNNGIGDTRISRGSDGNVRHNSKQMNRNTGNNGMENSYSPSSPDVPLCKDYLKGVCNRPPGSCKYRHINSQNEIVRVNRNGNGRNLNNGNGKNLVMRRRGSDGLYDCAPETKKIRPNETNGYGYGCGEEFNEDFYVGNSIGQGYSALPLHSETHQMQNPGAHVPTSAPDNLAFSQFHQTPVTSAYATVTVAQTNRNGYNSGGAGDSSVSAYMQSADTIKALEDENFMLKRRIEELKTSNEFLLNQNAQLRLNSSLSVSRTSVGVENVQVQPAVGVASVANGVVQTMVSMAQPMGITPSLSVAATQPLSTISTLPTVSMPNVSISQALPVVSIAQHQPQSVYPMVTTGVITQAANLT